jgi:arylsulfatase A-like enzyme
MAKNKNSIRNPALTRRSVLAGGAGLTAALSLPGLARAMESGKNVLLVSIDDLRPMLGAYGASLVQSPRIDAFARTALLFERAYVQQAICAPSRANLMTGLRPDSTGIYGLNRRVSDALPDHVTLSQAFRNAGYETISIGKIYHHADDDIGSWSVPPHDAYLDPTFADNRQSLTPESYLVGIKWGEAGNLDRRGNWRAPPFEAADVGDHAYPDGRNTLYAIQQLARLDYKKSPFLMCMGFRRPHLAFYAPRKYWDLYDPAKIELPSWRTAAVGAPDYALARSGETRNYADTEQDPDVPFSEEFTRKMIHGYMACVSYVDALFGQIMDALAQYGLAENTIIALWGDHGYKLGEYGQFNKHSNYEIDTRIPLMIRTPGMKSGGRKSNAFVETVDIYPTLLELAGLDNAQPVEGLSFAPLVEAPDRPWKTATFQQYPRNARDSDGVGDVPISRNLMGYAVRTDAFRYVVWLETDTGKITARELYDLRIDPGETVNRINERKYRQDIKKLEALRQGGWRVALPR